MTSVDRCQACGQDVDQEWVPPVLLGGRTLAGTGLWRGLLIEGRCNRCWQTFEEVRTRERRGTLLREQFIRLTGGVKPYREFTFDRYDVTTSNRAAVQLATHFDPANNNLYLWGPCGVGKTHLAVAILRRWFARGASIALITPFQLIRRLRMRPPDEEQQAIDAILRVGVLAIDDLGVGGDTAYFRQVLQEILDGRHFHDRGGLIVTSQYSPNVLAKRWMDEAISSRLAGMCQVIGIRGSDRRRIEGGSSG